jgi:hypothetical protein
MDNTNIDKVTEEIILIVQDNFHKLNANKRYTLRQMAGEDQGFGKRCWDEIQSSCQKWQACFNPYRRKRQ